MANSAPSRTITLPPYHEFRFELEQGEAIQVTLLQGVAEVFGFELVLGQAHPFGNEARAAIWTAEGAEIEISGILFCECMVLKAIGIDFFPIGGKAETSYVATESPLPAYLSLHLALARLRLLARPSSFNSTTASALMNTPDDEIPCPRVMVVGERGSGKSSLIKTLINWRVREMNGKGLGKTGAGGVFVNLDVGEGGMTVPGTMTLMSMRSLLPTTTPISSLGTSITSGPLVPFPEKGAAGGRNEWTPSPSVDAYSPPVNPLVFWHGHPTPLLNKPLYELLLKRLGKSLNRKLSEGGVESWKAGCLVDTPGEWAEKKNMNSVAPAVRALEINILLVVGSERLLVEMKRLMSTNKMVTVVRVPRSDGASEPDTAYQSRVQAAQIKSYFYGGPELTQGVLSPFSIIVKFEDLKVYRVGEAAETQAPSSALPIGASRTVGDTELVPLDLTLPGAPSQLLNRILGIPQASDDADQAIIVASPVLGFVYVSAMDTVKKKVTLLSPLPGRLPRKSVILASLDWQDA